MTRRMTPDKRKQQILEVATLLAEHKGLYTFTSIDVAQRSGVSHGTVFNYFGNTEELRQTVIKHAIETVNTRVLIYAILAGDALVDDLPQDKRDTVVQQINNLVMS